MNAAIIAAAGALAAELAKGGASEAHKAIAMIASGLDGVVIDEEVAILRDCADKLEVLADKPLRMGSLPASVERDMKYNRGGVIRAD